MQISFPASVQCSIERSSPHASDSRSTITVAHVSIMRRRVVSFENTKTRVLRRHTRRLVRLVVVLLCFLAPLKRATVRLTEKIGIDDKVYKFSAPRVAQGWASFRTYRFAESWHNRHVRNYAIYTCIVTARVPILNIAVYHLLICPDVLYSNSWRHLFDVPALCISHSCLSRFGKSHYVYAEFIVRTFEKVQTFDLAPPRQTPQGNVAVLLEPRRHLLLQYVVKQVMATLGKEWSLQLFLSDINIEITKKMFDIFPGKAGANIRVVNLSNFGFQATDFGDNRLQSALSVHKELYQKITSEHILWFQLDTIMRHRVPASLLHQHFIGSEWRGCEYPNCRASVCKKVCGGGNSGLSLRKRSTILMMGTSGSLPGEVWGIRNTSTGKQNVFESDLYYDRNGKNWYEDDLLLSYKLATLGLLSEDGTQRQFAIGETEGIKDGRLDPAGLHKSWLAVHIHPLTVLNLLDEPFTAIHS